MKLKKLVCAALAVILALSCTVSAGAATSSDEPVPDLVFYRDRPTDTFEGELDIRNGAKSEVSAVQIKEGETPSFFIAGHDDTHVTFDSLYKAAEEVLLVTRDGKEQEVPVGLAVYDRVSLAQATGSVTLTVKDNHTLKPVSGAVYSLYQAGKPLKEGLTASSDGTITVDKLLPGSYELRPISPAAGYQATEKPVPFIISGLALSGGDSQIRTTAGKKVKAEENETLIAGTFSPDIELTVSNEKQISSVTVTFQNYNASLETSGKAKKEVFSTAQEAQEAINKAKQGGEITGPVDISYELTGGGKRSTCNYVQYVETAAAPTPTPIATPIPTWNGGSQGGVAAPTPAPTPTPVPTATPVPVTDGSVTVYASCNGKPLPNIMFELIGKTSSGTGVDKTYRTDTMGLITIEKVPEGEYTLTVLETEETENYSIPYDQRVLVGAGASSYNAVEFSLLTNTILGVVSDTDGMPLSNVTVGLFPVDERTEQENLSGSIESNHEVDDISGRTYYNAANALALAVTDDVGEFKFSYVDLGLYELMPLVSGGYYAPEKPIQYNVSREAGDTAEIVVGCTQAAISYLGRRGGQLTGRTVTIDDREGTSWVTTEEPMVLKGLLPGRYTLIVQDEEGKEPIDAFSFTLEDTAEIQKIVVETSAEKGETNIPEDPAEEKDSQEPERAFPVIPVVAASLVLAGAAGFLIWRHFKRKPEKGGVK